MNSFVIPPKLEKGDKIRIISPSGKIDKNVILDAAKVIEKWGFEVEISENAFAEHGRYAGTDSQRATDIENAFKDKSVKAILCSRGGYGIVRLIGLIDENVIKSNPKWLLGYSDVTALHQILLKNGIASLHCQMARAISDNPESLPVGSILSVINGGKYSVELENTHKLNKTGHVTAEICGGNLAVMGGLRGTDYDYDYNGKILFLEDIGESPYKIDRYIQNLRIGNVLNQLKGLIIGQFTDCGEENSYAISN